jgi:hypothetical protein
MRYGIMKEPYFFLRSTWEIFLQKFKINSCLLNDVEFPTKAICYHKKNFHTSCLFCVEFYQVLLTLAERFIMLTRSKSRQATNMCCFYNGSTQNTLFVYPKMLCSYTERRQKKNMMVRFYQNKCSSSC